MWPTECQRCWEAQIHDGLIKMRPKYVVLTVRSLKVNPEQQRHWLSAEKGKKEAFRCPHSHHRSLSLHRPWSQFGMLLDYHSYTLPQRNIPAHAVPSLNHASVGTVPFFFTMPTWEPIKQLPPAAWPNQFWETSSALVYFLMALESTGQPALTDLAWRGPLKIHSNSHWFKSRVAPSEATGITWSLHGL